MVISISIVRTGEREDTRTRSQASPQTAYPYQPCPARPAAAAAAAWSASCRATPPRSAPPPPVPGGGPNIFGLRCRYFCARVLGYCCLVDVRSLVAGEGAGHGGGAGRGGGAPAGAGAAPGRHQPHAGAAAALLALIFTFNQLELELNICGLNVCCLVWLWTIKSFITEINMMKSKL